MKVVYDRKLVYKFYFIIFIIIASGLIAFIAITALAWDLLQKSWDE